MSAARGRAVRPSGVPAWVWQDRCWSAAIHVLLAPCIRDKAFAFIDFEDSSIDWPGLLEASGPWSHGERLLVKTAANLWNGRAPVNLRELLTTLDAGNFERVIQAIRLCRGGGWGRPR